MTIVLKHTRTVLIHDFEHDNIFKGQIINIY